MPHSVRPGHVMPTANQKHKNEKPLSSPALAKINFSDKFKAVINKLSVEANRTDNYPTILCANHL
jgi:hypothetical protein